MAVPIRVERAVTQCNNGLLDIKNQASHTHPTHICHHHCSDSFHIRQRIKKTSGDYNWNILADWLAIQITYIMVTFAQNNWQMYRYGILSLPCNKRLTTSEYQGLLTTLSARYHLPFRLIWRLLFYFLLVFFPLTCNEIILRIKPCEPPSRRNQNIFPLDVRQFQHFHFSAGNCFRREGGSKYLQNRAAGWVRWRTHWEYKPRAASTIILWSCQMGGEGLTTKWDSNHQKCYF